MMLVRSIPLGIALFLCAFCLSVTNAQFTCTLTNTEEDSCLQAVGDDQDHCVWCTLAGFGFCLGEQQAEQMEQTLPNIQCDRYSGTDDAAPKPDDDATPTPPSDDSIPDDFWTCLQKANAKACLEADCTWCDSNKFGFGLCMTGPTAESAADSDFFTCSNSSTFVLPVMPIRNSKNNNNNDNNIDTTCVTAYLQDPTQEGCTSSQDSQGTACEWCSIAGMTNICLTKDQADITSPLGVSCLEQQQQQQQQQDRKSSSLMMLRGGNNHQQQEPQQQARRPLDGSCWVAYLQDPSEGGCHSALDQDGNSCEFCTLRLVGPYPPSLCLNPEQAMYGQQVGMMECTISTASINWKEAKREDIRKNDDDLEIKSADPNPYDPTCAMAFFTNPNPDSCTSAMDQQGQACEYCTLQGGTLNLCLTHQQAQTGAAALGIHCDDDDKTTDDASTTTSNPLYDNSCLMAFAKASGHISPEDCTAATDNDGVACEFCSIPGITDSLCVTQAQANMASQVVGAKCGGGAAAAAANLSLPPNFLECLEEYQEGDCNAAAAGCSWCMSSVGIGFCMSEAAARALAECNFFSCDRTEHDDTPEFVKKAHFPLDPVCLAAGMNSDDNDNAETDCNETMDSQGTASCIWCNAAGVYGLCMSSEGADMAREYLDCDSSSGVAADDSMAVSALATSPRDAEFVLVDGDWIAIPPSNVHNRDDFDGTNFHDDETKES